VPRICFSDPELGRNPTTSVEIRLCVFKRSGNRIVISRALNARFSLTSVCITSLNSCARLSLSLSLSRFLPRSRNKRGDEASPGDTKRRRETEKQSGFVRRIIRARIDRAIIIRRSHRRQRYPITNIEEQEKEGGQTERKRDTIADNKNKIDAMPRREAAAIFRSFPDRRRFASPSPPPRRRALFLFRSIFRRGASVAHPSTNRRGGALTRQARFDGNDKASAVIFGFLRGVPAIAVNQCARARARDSSKARPNSWRRCRGRRRRRRRSERFRRTREASRRRTSGTRD